MQCKATDKEIATNKSGLANIPTVNKEDSSDNALIALNISIITKTVSERVEAFYFPHVK